MSWPADGLPRYKLARTDGILDLPMLKSRNNDSAQNTKWQATFAILDRAFCHRVVSVFRTEDFAGQRGQLTKALVKAEAAAPLRLDALNSDRDPGDCHHEPTDEHLTRTGPYLADSRDENAWGL